MKIYSVFHVILLFIMALNVSGCADKRWREPLKENDDKAVRSLISEEIEKRESCTCCVDAEVTLRWDTQLNDGGLSGFIQILLPSSIKLVAINPLGQPMYALSTDGKNFQAINAVKGVYKYGKISSFIERHNLPKDIFHEEWANWLSGSMKFDEDKLVELRGDIESRGVWLKIQKKAKARISHEYLLYDAVNRQLLERVAIASNGHEIARIVYREWTAVNGCPLPQEIEVYGISYGTDIFIRLKDIINDSTFSHTTFNLQLPPGYVQQYYP